VAWGGGEEKGDEQKRRASFDEISIY